MAKKSVSKPSAQPTFFDRYGHLFTFERIMIGIIVLSIVGVVGLVLLNAWNNRTIEIAGVVEKRGLSGGHSETVTYNGLSLPPMGGIHHPTWQNCGIYLQPIRTENALHSLEHGAVWITYQPTLPEDQVKKLQDRFYNNSYVLMSPYPGLKSPIVLTAWGVQLEVDNADDGRIGDFVHNYEQGPQTPEKGALCTRGIGQPLN